MINPVRRRNTSLPSCSKDLFKKIMKGLLIPCNVKSMVYNNHAKLPISLKLIN